MVSKVIINPEQVRALGNIVSAKSRDDFATYKSHLSSVGGVYTMEFNGITITLTVSSTRVYTGTSITCTATLKDANGDPITGADIDFYYEVI